MATPFEEPAKTEMRARCEIAIDQAAQELVQSMVRIELPSPADLYGAIRGDLQGLDAEGNRHCYYLRPSAGDTLPKWLANLAREAHSIDGVRVYVVANDPSPQFEKACKAAGAGLLALTADNEFHLILDFDTTLPEALDSEFEARLQSARRRLESTLDLRLDELRSRFGTVGGLTHGMDPDLAEKYTENVERLHRIWSDWGDGMAVRLDAMLSSRDPKALEALEEAIEAGPVLDDDV